MTDEAYRMRDLAPGNGASGGSNTLSNAPPAVLAVDLGGTHLRTAVTDRSGAVHGRTRRPTPLQDGAAAVIRAAVDAARSSVEAWRALGHATPLAGIGISAPGPLDPVAGVLIDPPNLGREFWGLGLANALGEPFGLPAFLERDTHVAALAEGAYGAGRDLSDFVYLTVSTGIGGAVVTDGRLMSGPDGVAGELGHLTVDMDGPPCGCGARGHLEAMSSGTGIARSAREALAGGRRSPGLEAVVSRLAPARLEAVHVSEAADAGDPLALEIMETARRAFAAGVVSIVDVFNPQRVIVGGGIAIAHGDRLLGPARDAVERTAFRVQARRAEIVPAALGDDVSLIGALPLVERGLARARIERSVSQGGNDRSGESVGTTQRTAAAPALSR